MVSVIWTQSTGIGMHVVDTINQHPRFEIAYINDMMKQQFHPAHFAEEVSPAGFWCSTGALACIHKPLETEWSSIDCSSAGTFMSRRKKKFDLNSQCSQTSNGNWFIAIRTLFDDSIWVCALMKSLKASGWQALIWKGKKVPLPLQQTSFNCLFTSTSHSASLHGLLARQ